MRLTVSNGVLKFRNSGHDEKIIEPEVICKLRENFERKHMNTVFPQK